MPGKCFIYILSLVVVRGSVSTCGCVALTRYCALTIRCLHRSALEVINRIQAKLTGRDFAKNEEADDLTIEEQVERLIVEATSIENLCQLFTGWCPLW
jgi:hypothetical protein